MKILVSCLEASANLHLAEVLKHLKNSEICGIFDKKFGEVLYDSKEFSAMGFVEILPLIFKAKKALKQMVLLAENCDKVLLIDSPAFNLPLAKAIKEAGLKCEITYYILPQVWAWKSGRVAKVEKYCDNLASILPFDASFYSRSNYVGHPLLDEIKVHKRELLNSGIVAFLPGSRKSEITKLMPVYKEVALSLNGKKLLVVPPNLKNDIDEIYGDVSEFQVVFDTHKALLQSEFAFVCSGTATLEAALIGTPFVLCYKAKAIDIWLARKLVKLKHVGLANIIFDFMGKEALNVELIQEQVSKKALLDEYKNCDKSKFLRACKELRDYLKHGSAKKVADILLSQI
ncbi:ipid-A-disaccharide synthase [Campylobacter hyointestinalis]|uniref:Lipid-A-disaccharide synthase n=1 Tax=Campylobacter hyointestinalis subsp. hyointestinalis TaxID=91352 RepID=A0A9W5AV14_CAMHY|nr:lipid-A-disaccharide synthase [Campylobacter hyointestinalis]PPB53204.1 lipid-A-disaccharide synthase [Campylobacter hyointestinalis subsp. hyointestinalis]PPB55285.1 lipid-A-disaccharide synthase [Campylobacter hyointestinalis subsp. hyointestinalis]PPB62485.1 lipid-A-disaccharide synthase [Campylobacter hyointestinalis subsp. hyointestinalis]PPB64123.1 lipid-A-disaccharide synthase [Campylobacter hyointestinalis subsp. hyointestinalis]PPB66588.1 lipid-A-disaccharide synthase [Campylobacte